MTKNQKWITAFLCVIALLAVLIYFFNWNLLRGFVERRVSQASGRSFAIGGDMDVHLSWHPRITLNDVSMGNAAWSKTPTMFHIGQAQITLDIPSLFHPEVLIPELRLQQADVLLEKNAAGVGNWVFEKPGSSSAKTVKLQQIDIRDSRLAYNSPADKTDFVVKVSSTRSGNIPMLSIDASGHYQSLATEAHGEVGAINSLADLQRDYPIRIAGDVGKTRIRASGTVTNPMAMEGLAVNFELSGKSLADLYGLIGVPLPPSPPYSLAGHMTHKQSLWDLDSFKGRVGKSDLGGRFSVDRGRRPQFMRANLRSNNLDLNDLSGFIGARNEEGNKVVPRGDRVLPDSPFNLEKLRAADMDIEFRGKRILTKKLPIDDLHAHMLVDGGKLSFDPLNFGVAGGDITSTIHMNARVSPMVSEADIRVKRIHLKELFDGLEFEKVNTGLIGGHAKFAVNGNSIAQMLGSANGQVSILMDGGSVSKLVLRLANLDVANSLLVLLTGDKSVPVRCMITDLHAQDGLMKVSTMVLDTDKEIIHGSGSINFRNESLDLKLRADPKDVSIVALRGPIDVTGTFKTPKARPSVVQPAGRVALAAALATISGPLALLPLIDLGGGDDSNCGKLIQQSHAKVSKTVAPAKEQKSR